MAGTQRAFGSALGKVAILIAIAGLFLVGMAGTVYLSLHSPEVEVPEVTGKNIVDAEQVLSAAGLNVRRRATRYSSEVKADTVLDQTPRAGDHVKAGQTVAVVISRAEAKEGESSVGVRKGDETKNDNQNSSAGESESASANNRNDNANENRPKRNANKNKNANANNANNANGNTSANGNINSNLNANLTTNSRNNADNRNAPEREPDADNRNANTRPTTNNTNLSPVNRNTGGATPNTNAAANTNRSRTVNNRNANPTTGNRNAAARPAAAPARNANNPRP